MTDVTAPLPLYGAKPTTSTAIVAQEDASVLSSDFETFLKMLTVQMQNQDPLNPVDSTEYATQLATFSSVEQQVQTNDLLREMSAALGGTALKEFGSWIGMEGLVRAPVLFDGRPVSIRPDYTPEADRARLVVRSADGTEIARHDLDLAQDAILWDGRDASGAQHPSGVYRFDVESYQGDTMLSSQPAQVFSRIEEVRDSNGTAILRLADGTEVAPAQVSGLRSAELG